MLGVGAPGRSLSWRLRKSTRRSCAHRSRFQALGVGLSGLKFRVSFFCVQSFWFPVSGVGFGGVRIKGLGNLDFRGSDFGNLEFRTFRASVHGGGFDDSHYPRYHSGIFFTMCTFVRQCLFK